MGFIKGTLFFASGGLFRPTSKRERSQRTVAGEARDHTRLLQEQNWLIAQGNQALASQAAGWADVNGPTPTTDAQPEMSKLDKLAALNELHTLGVLSDEEFAEQKAATLGRPADSEGGQTNVSE